jgi:hypothetical protein
MERVAAGYGTFARGVRRTVDGFASLRARLDKALVLLLRFLRLGAAGRTRSPSNKRSLTTELNFAASMGRS